MAGGDHGVVKADDKRSGEVASAASGEVSASASAQPEPPATDPTGATFDDPDADRTLKPSTLSPVDVRGVAAAKAAARRESAVRMASVPVISPDDAAGTDVRIADHGDPGDISDDPTQLNRRTLALAHEDDATRLDPQAQAVALDELRHLSAELNKGPVVAPFTAVATASSGASPHPGATPARSSNRHLLARPPSDLIVPTDEPEEETHGMGLDGAELFSDVGGQRRVGGTALLSIISTTAPAYSALPRDVSVFIQEDSIENLPAHGTSTRRTLVACLVGISVAAALVAGYFALFAGR